MEVSAFQRDGHVDIFNRGSVRQNTFRRQSNIRVGKLQCIDRQRARRTTSLDVVAEQTDPVTSGATVARDHALRRTVGSAVDGLPARQKQALTLVHYQGFSQQEAAEALAVSVDAVESLLARARRTLKSQLKDLAGDLLEEW